MFAKIAGFELRYQMRNPIFWIAVIACAVMAFSVTISQAWMGRIGVHKNAPYAIAQVYVRFTLLYMFVSAAFVANVVVRDDETGFGQIVRATRISKGEYLFGRFVGAFLATPLSFLAVPIAIWIGTLVAGLDPDRFGQNHLPAYLMPYLTIALPNLFLNAALLFAVATMARSMMATYVGVVAFLMLWASAMFSLWAHHGLLAAYVARMRLTPSRRSMCASPSSICSCRRRSSRTWSCVMTRPALARSCAQPASRKANICWAALSAPSSPRR